MMRVLLVDDEPPYLEAAKAHFEQDREIRADTATSAALALSMIETGGYDAVVADQQMPQMSGIELLKALRDRNNEIPFILLTARGAEDAAIDALKSGADSYLPKDDMKSEFPELVRMVKESVNLRRSKSNESDLRFRDMLDRLADAVVVFDGQYRLTFWNRAAEEFYGWKREEVIGRNGEQVFRTEFVKASKEAILESLQKTGFYKGQLVQHLKNGSPITVEVAATALTDASGKMDGFVSVNRDVTVQKRAEQKLVESERSYKTIFESTGAGMIVIESDMTISMANAEFLRMSGYSMGEIIGRKFTDFLPREEIPRLASYHRQRRKDEAMVPRNYELTLNVKSGVPRMFNVSVSLIPGTGKSIASFLDITERLKAEKAARDAERFLDSVFSSIQDGISILDKDLRIVRVNPTMERWYAHNMPLVGRKCYQAYHNRSEPCAVCPTMQTLRTGKVAVEVVPKVGPGGVEVGWLELYSFPRFSQGTGDLDGIIEYVRDVSDRKRYEDALKQANEKLNLLGNVTRHDALNQLGVLSGWLSIATDSTDDKDMREYLKKVHDAANMIRAQLEFTADYQEMGIRGPIWIGLETAFNRGVAGLRFGDVAITLDFKGIDIFADPMIDRVFHNLADNSLRHGGRLSKIDVWTERSEEDLKIIYTDDGQGIPHSEKPKIFYHGYGKHSGYGLYMARAILGITSISIDEVGEPGVGARFVISVPSQKYRVHDESA